MLGYILIHNCKSYRARWVAIAPGSTTRRFGSWFPTPEAAEESFSRCFPKGTISSYQALKTKLRKG